ncbi:hypothetical protein ABPG72_017686 [Tetrahymena utriculariae]
MSNQQQLSESINKTKKIHFLIEENQQYREQALDLEKSLGSVANLENNVQNSHILLQLNQNSVDHSLFLGQTYQSKHMLDETIQQYLIYLQINPNNDSCYMNLGTAYYEKGMISESITQYFQCLKQNPKNDICFMNLGLAYQAKGILEEAIQSYQKCLELNPTSDFCLFNLGSAYQEKNNLSEAILSYKKCLQLNPKIILIIYVQEMLITKKKYVQIVQNLTFKALDQIQAIKFVFKIQEFIMQNRIKIEFVSKQKQDKKDKISINLIQKLQKFLKSQIFKQASNRLFSNAVCQIINQGKKQNALISYSANHYNPQDLNSKSQQSQQFTQTSIISQRESDTITKNILLYSYQQAVNLNPSILEKATI